MTDEQMRDLVKECGLDWQRGYMPLFDNDPTNRYAVLIDAAVAKERERLIALARSRADYEAKAAAHYAGNWQEAYEKHLTRYSAMSDIVHVLIDEDAIRKEPTP